MTRILYMPGGDEEFDALDLLLMVALAMLLKLMVGGS